VWVVGLGTDTALGSGPVSVGDASGDGATVRADFGPRTLANSLNFAGGGVHLGVTGVNDLTFSGPINLGTAASQNFDIISRAVTTLSGVISGGAGVGLIKNGGGALVLSGINTYPGDVILNAGVLGLGSDSTGAVTGGPLGTGTLNVYGGNLRAVNTNGGTRVV